MGRPRKDPSEPELVWEAPPERILPSMYDGLAEQIKARPGSWGRVRVVEVQTTAHSAAGGLKKRLQRNGDRAWETRVAKVEGEEAYGIYLRYRTKEQMKAAGE